MRERGWYRLALLLALAALAGCDCGSAAEEQVPLAEHPGPRSDCERDSRLDALLDAQEDDPLELARVLDRSGDESVLCGLAEGASPRAQWRAARAAPFMSVPEAAMPALVTLAQGRDPHLAPIASDSLWAIARELTVDDLAAHDSHSTIERTRSELALWLSDESARADILRLRSLVVLELQALSSAEINP